LEFKIAINEFPVIRCTDIGSM